MERIKGFTIDLELDSIKVDTGLKDLRSSMRLMNSEMRKNMSAFDWGERSLEKYGVQLEGLNKKLELQEKVTESARKTYEKMVDEHGEGSRQANNAAAAYNHEASQLNNLERHIQRVTDEMKEFERQQSIQNSTLYKSGDALISFGDGLDGISSKARDVGGSLTKYVTTPIAGLLGVVGGMGFKRAMDIEQVEMMMEHISDSTEEYEKRMENVVDLVTDTRFGTAELGAEYAKFIGASAEDASASLYSEVAMNLASFKSDDQLIPQIGDLFTKALQSGKVDGQMINQFTNAGVDILKVLGNKWGMETDAVRERLQDGSIDIHDVLDELSEGILEGTEGELGVTKAMGGMLEKSGRTLSGQIKNFFAAIAIRGENLIKETGLFDGVKDTLDELRNMLRSGELDAVLLPTFQGLAKALEALVDVARKVFKWFSSLSGQTKEWIGNLVGISAIIGPIVVGLGIFGGILAKVSRGLGKFLKFLAPIGKSVGLLGRLFAGLTNPIGIAITVITILTTAFVTAYRKSETFRDFVHDLGEKIRDVFIGIIDWIMPGVDAVVGFFDETKDKIVEFINTDGTQLLEAFQNIGTFISTVASNIWTAIKWTFEQIKWIIADYVMPVVEFIIELVWGNIQGIITGALDVIMGAVRIFSGLFTGDFSLMWEGVKDIFFGSIEVVWNWVQLLFIDRLLKGVLGFARGFWGRIKDMWQWIKEAFTNSITAVYTGVKESFIGRIIGSIIGFVKNFRTNISTMWSNVKSTFSQRISEIRSSIANSFVGRMLSSVRELKDRFIGIASDMWGGVRKQFDKIVDGAKALPGRIGKGIRNARDKATDGMKSVGNKVIEWAGTPFNKVVDGVNWVTGKLGIKKKIPTWDYPQYAKGTDGHPGGPAIIGEKGRELVKLPDGRSFVSPDGDTLVDLPKGTHVIPNKPTEQILKSDIPHYSKGTGFWEGVKNVGSKIKSGVSKAWNFVGDVWDYATNPSKLVNLIVDKIGLTKNMAEIPKAVVSGGFDYVKSKPLEFIKNAFSRSGGDGKPAFDWPVTSPFGYRIHPISGERKLHGGVDFGAPSGTPIPSTTGGTVSYAGHGWNGGFGNLVKVKQGMWEMFYAHLSKILVSAGQSVRKGDIIGHVGSTGASTGPHLHYETRKNGVRVNPMTLKGFKTGGVIRSKMMAMLGEDGEEIVIPTARNRRTDAMKLLALAAKKIGVDDGSYTRPSGVTNPKTEESELLKAVLEQNKYLKKSNELLMQLVEKKTDVYLGRRKVNEEMDDEQSTRIKLGGRVAY